MTRLQRIRRAQRTLSARSHARWSAFQPDLREVERARANRDGTIPRPRYAAVTPTQQARFDAREALRRTFDSPAYRGLRIAQERQIGATLDFASLPPDQQALKAGRPVVRIVTLTAPGIQPQGFATGFLVGADLLLTNHHVFPVADEARTSGAQFFHEQTREGLREGPVFALDPGRFFLNDEALDYAIVAVAPESRDRTPLGQLQLQYLPLIGAKGKILKGDPVSIIQYPEGGPKQYATVNNHLLDLRDDGFLLYETDTLEGSSGSPVFNQHWETIGLHHCGVPAMENGKLVTRDGRRVSVDADVEESDLMWIANEGIRVSALVESLKSKRMGRADQQAVLERLIASTGDPLLLVGAAPPALDADAPARPTGGTDMSPIRFEFAGPVTIYVGGSGSGVTVAAPTPSTAATTSDVGLAPEKALRFDENYQDRTQHGYKPSFLSGWRIPAPTLNAKHVGKPLLGANGKPWVIPYYHYSLMMNRDRRLLSWAASNVDYSAAARKHTKARKDYGGEDWRLDPRVALAKPGLQIDDPQFYEPAKKIDRGHIVRREDGAWGSTDDEAEFGNSDTYHWTNCTPQSFAFNQSKEKGLWGLFENHIQKAVVAEGGRMSIFAGPVLKTADPKHGYPGRQPVQVPMEFWKVVICVSKESGKSVRRAYGFVFDQTKNIQEHGFEKMNMDEFKIEQTPLAQITAKTGVVFDASVLAADVLKAPIGPERLAVARPIASLSDLVLG
jgi:endonuclease G, mitochondrial